MSKRTLETPADEGPAPKRARTEPAAALALVPVIYGISAAALDPISQRAFCCASRGCAEAMGPLRSPFPIPMLQWIAAPENDDIPWAYVLNKQRRAIAKQRIRMGLHYDHAAFILFHMPFLQAVEYGVENRYSKWLKQLMAFDAAECFVRLLPSLTGGLVVREDEIRKTIQNTFLAHCLHPKLSGFAMTQQWITLQSMFEHGHILKYAPGCLRTVFRAASVADVVAVAETLDSDGLQGAAACRGMLVPVLRQFARGDPTALNAILDAMAKEDKPRK